MKIKFKVKINIELTASGRFLTNQNQMRRKMVWNIPTHIPTMLQVISLPTHSPPCLAVSPSSCKQKCSKPRNEIKWELKDISIVLVLKVLNMLLLVRWKIKSTLLPLHKYFAVFVVNKSAKFEKTSVVTHRLEVRVSLIVIALIANSKTLLWGSLLQCDKLYHFG